MLDYTSLAGAESLNSGQFAAKRSKPIAECQTTFSVFLSWANSYECLDTMSSKSLRKQYCMTVWNDLEVLLMKEWRCDPFIPSQISNLIIKHLGLVKVISTIQLKFVYVKKQET